MCYRQMYFRAGENLGIRGFAGYTHCKDTSRRTYGVHGWYEDPTYLAG